MKDTFQPSQQEEYDKGVGQARDALKTDLVEDDIPF